MESKTQKEFSKSHESFVQQANNRQEVQHLSYPICGHHYYNPQWVMYNPHTPALLYSNAVYFTVSTDGTYYFHEDYQGQFYSPAAESTMAPIQPESERPEMVQESKMVENKSKSSNIVEDKSESGSEAVEDESERTEIVQNETAGAEIVEEKSERSKIVQDESECAEIVRQDVYDTSASSESNDGSIDMYQTKDSYSNWHSQWNQPQMLSNPYLNPWQRPIHRPRKPPHKQQQKGKNFRPKKDVRNTMVPMFPEAFALGRESHWRW